MNRITTTTLLAIALLAIGFGPTAAADGHCTQPADGVEACQADGEIERVTVTFGEEGLAKLAVSYEDTETWGGMERSAEAEASTSKATPVGDNAVTSSVTCTYDDSQVPCTELGVYTAAEKSLREDAYLRGTCEGLGSGQTPACQYFSAGIDASTEEGYVRAAGGCGSTGGFFGPATHCPRDTSAGVGFYVPPSSGGASGSADVNPQDPAASSAGAGACVSTPPTGFTCVP